jgi:putative salt-induced outer membrane protein YdiY
VRETHHCDYRYGAFHAPGPVTERRLWLLLAIILGGAVSGYAQTPAPALPVWNLDSPPPAAPPKSVPSPTPAPTPEKAAADALDGRVLGPEIWRLPPVTAEVAPAALLIAPAETIPTPPAEEKPPLANMPLSLSGVLSNGGRLEIKPEVDKPWDGSLDLGMDGSEGNSETFNLHVGFHAKRKADNNILTLGLDYNKQTAQTVSTTNRLYFDGRFERMLGASRWSLFAHETVEYDEFQPFDVRDTSDAGVGYRAIKNDNTTLVGRFGAGFSHEYGGPENGQYIPEIVFGLQLERQISKRQKFIGVAEYAPDVGDFLRYRLRTQAALEVLLDQEKNLSLRMGVLERYNSLPNGARPNDLDYALTLMWKL